MKIISLIFIILVLTSCFEKKVANQSNNYGVFKVEVNEKGYVPSVIKVPKKINTIKLLFTRTTDKTCAREVILEELNINKKLPLNQDVEVTLDIRGSDKLVFGCHMDKMFSGRIIKSSNVN